MVFTCYYDSMDVFNEASAGGLAFVFFPWD